MIRFLVFLLKEILECILRVLRKIQSGGMLNNSFSAEIDELSSKGIFIRPGYLSPLLCKELRDSIDEYIDSGKCKVWVDAEEADHRLYFIDEIDSRFKGILNDKYFLDVLRLYTGISSPHSMLLAAKLVYKDGNQGSGGGWHRDSPFQHQFKAICYLNDVEESNGPFEFILGSHTKMRVLKDSICRYWRPGQYRFSDAEISRYLECVDVNKISVCGAEGSLVLADTKGIHRGRPIEKGIRYVLFCYYWNDGIPSHFERLRQVIT